MGTGNRRWLAVAMIVANMTGGPAAWLDAADAVFATAAAARQPNAKERPAAPRPKADSSVKPAETTPGTPSDAPTPAAAEADKASDLTKPELAEKVEADVSARSIPVKLGFTGTEIIVFGSVDNSRQPSADAGYYDVIVSLEGQPTPIVVRKKSNVAGLWKNTSSFAFDRVPSYYAIAATRPIEEIADAKVLEENAIGFEHVKIRPKQGRVRTVPEAELQDYRDAVVRLKQKEGLYIKADYDVTFTGRSLFRATIDLPANIAVGPVEARVFLFREGKLLSQYASRVTIERKGVELWLHGFAHSYPLLYGIFTVAVAVSAGLLASAFFRR